MEVKALRHQALVESAKNTVLLSNGLDWSQPLHMNDLSPTKEKADPLPQPVYLLLQAAIAG